MFEGKKKSRWDEYEHNFREQCSKKRRNKQYVESCLAYAKQLFSQDLPIIFDGTHFCNLVGYEPRYIYGVTNSKNHYYKSYFIKKNNGGSRKIVEPFPSLKEIQRWILDNILSHIDVHRSAKAYRKNYKLIDNARFHIAQKLVLKIDIENFFPSIKKSYVNNIFKKAGYSVEVSKLLTELVTYQSGVPQGAPTSPALSNIIMYYLDIRIFEYATSKGLRYTRYADDITISGNFSVPEVLSFLKMVIEDNGFKVNTKKTQLLRHSNRQIITGVVVNKKLQAPKSYRKKIRQELFYIKKHGLDSHLLRIKEVRANYLAHLLGKANYVLSINPEDKDAQEVINFFAVR